MPPTNVLFSLVIAAVGAMLLVLAILRWRWPVIAATVTEVLPASRRVTACPAGGAPLVVTWPRPRGLPRVGARVLLTHAPGNPAGLRPHESLAMYLLAAALLLAAAVAPALLDR